VSVETWTVHLDGATARLIFVIGDDEANSSTGAVEVVLHRGAPDWGHPELRRGIVSVMQPGLFRHLMRPWTREIPAKYLERPNEGEQREFMLLRGGSLNWTLVLKFPRFTPDFVFERVALGFGATPYEAPAPKPRVAPPPPPKPKGGAKKAQAILRRRR